MLEVVVWGRERPRPRGPHVRAVCLETMHECVATARCGRAGQASVRTATLDQPEHGLTGSAARADRRADVVGHTRRTARARRRRRARRPPRERGDGGSIVLHSGHYSKAVQARCSNDAARSRGARPTSSSASGSSTQATRSRDGPAAPLRDRAERDVRRAVPHPAAGRAGLPLSWFEGGEGLPQRLHLKRGQGRIFYFSPGHEAYPIYRDANVQRVLRNARALGRADETVKDSLPERPARGRRRNGNGSKRSSSARGG